MRPIALTVSIIRLSSVLIQSKRILGRKGIREGSWRVGEGRISVWDGRRLLGLLLEEVNQVVAVLGLLETTKGHLGTGDVLLGVLEVLVLCCISL